jgi:polysaccharide pyruvyl transferase WcaK-like protein
MLSHGDHRFLLGSFREAGGNVEAGTVGINAAEYGPRALGYKPTNAKVGKTLFKGFRKVYFMFGRTQPAVFHSNTAESEVDHLKDAGKKRQKISFFGHFGTLNFGNESTFQSMLYHLRRLLAEAEVACICSFPEALATTGSIKAVPISRIMVKPWNLPNPIVRLLRKVFVGIPSELYRWLDAFRTLKGTDMFIIPGTGLLTDAYGLFGWGPYNLFKWTAMAKLRRCKVLFVSVGAGPIYGTLGKYLVKSALSLADFRSYRDESSREWLKGIGFRADNDQIYPDLVFSLPETVIPRLDNKQRSRSVVGLGLMEYAGRYSVAEPSNAIYLSYLDNLVVFVKWLLAQDYDVRLLIGDDYDNPVTQEFRSLLSSRLGPYDEKRIIDQPISSAQQLLSQLAATDIVVATRFHNILLALLLNKPVISISFHHKCTSLMSEMGLLEYCHDINHMHADRLIEQFQDVERNAEKLKTVIRQKVEQSRKALDEQYSLILKCV